MKDYKPKPACVINDEPWWDFSYEYDFEGKTWGFEVRARSLAEANERMKKIALARYSGQIDGKPIPAWHGRFWVPLVVWWRNWSREMFP
jgi:hypothetical protein